MQQPKLFSNRLPKRFVSTTLSVCLAGILMAACSSNGAANSDANASANTSTDSSSTTAAAKPTSNNPNSDADVVAALQSNLEASGLNDTVIESAELTDMDGIYWVTASDLPPFFADKSGKYIIQGQIVELGGSEPVDISAQLLEQRAKSQLAAIDKSNMIIYPASGETKSVIYAFTDPTCPYCQKLHDDIGALNSQGIEVRYLASQRNEQALPIVEAVWCSEDKNAAMDQAKAGQNVQAPRCDSPVTSQMTLGRNLGVRGTPAVFTQDGVQIGGYLPPAEIARVLGL